MISSAWQIPRSIKLKLFLTDKGIKVGKEGAIMTKFASRRVVPRDQVLLHELNHRVNNEFAAAISVVSLAAARSSNDEVKAALSEVGELLHQCADVHRALQVPEHDILMEAEMYVRQLCLSISRSYLDHRR